MIAIENYISPVARAEIAQAIADAAGNEVYFLGYLDHNLIVAEIEVVARGNEVSVPAVLELAQDADVVLHNHPSGRLTPSEPDIAIASYLGTIGVAFYIVDNPANRIYVVVEPIVKKEYELLDSQKIAALVKPGSPISKKLSGYEERSQQIEMIDSICYAFNNNEIAVIEAGTGTGKTLAYLLPSIYWALQNKERVVISTNTINLQEQVIKKDIPFLKQVFPEEFEAVLVKGRGNYVCLRKADDLASELELSLEKDEQDELSDLLSWARNSREGSKADLNYVPKDQVWDRIAAEGDTCMRSKCPHFKACFVNNARRKAANAHILIVNHSLLFADLGIKRQTGDFFDAAVLPPYHRIIFDEAHHIEDVATQYFGDRITRAGILRQIHRLYREQKGLAKGHLHILRTKIKHYHRTIPQALYQGLLNEIETILIPQVQQATTLTHAIMDQVYRVIQNNYSETIDKEIKVRLRPEVADFLMQTDQLEQEVANYFIALHDLSGELLRLVGLVRELQRHAQDKWDSIIIEVNAIAERLRVIAEILKDVLFNRDDEKIRWIETSAGYHSANIVRFFSSPLRIDTLMKTSVFEVFKTIVMTSATLTVEQKFDFLEQRIGLSLVPSSKKRHVILPAPFDYQRQVILGIPVDFPDPSHPRFADELGKAIFKAITISEGRAFVLFTSYGLLNLIFNQLSASLELIGITALKQGTLNRHELLRQFRHDKTSVLFGTDSFWEGVDVEGEALESVIITKLPFQVPSEPVIQARYENIEREGGNAFMEYAVPLAVLKLKQGFGRLIRRKTDRGCVIIFDNRIIRKNYGKRFLRSLPPTNMVTDNAEAVFSALKNFFNSPRA